MIGEEKASVAITFRSIHKMTGLYRVSRLSPSSVPGYFVHSRRLSSRAPLTESLEQATAIRVSEYKSSSLLRRELLIWASFGRFCVILTARRLRTRFLSPFSPLLLSPFSLIPTLSEKLTVMPEEEATTVQLFR